MCSFDFYGIAFPCDLNVTDNVEEKPETSMLNVAIICGGAIAMSVGLLAVSRFVELKRTMRAEREAYHTQFAKI